MSSEADQAAADKRVADEAAAAAASEAVAAASANWPPSPAYFHVHSTSDFCRCLYNLPSIA
jgi:hypothetical protein